MSTDTPKIEVLEADGGKKEIKWKCYEYIGVEVYGAPPGLSLEEVQSTANWPEGFELKPILERDAIDEGSVIIIPGLFGGICAYRVERMPDGNLCGMSGKMFAAIEFGEDDRNCWVCVGMGNLAAIQRLELTK